MKLFDNKFTILEKGLDAYSIRSRALANNIANVNTPKYKREDIQFEELLSEALGENSPKIEGNKTDAMHMEINSVPKLDSLEPNFIKDKKTFMRNDKNNVDIEKEQAEFAKNNIRYQFASNRISSNFTLLKSVIKAK